MGLTLANNVTSLNAQHNLTRANDRLTKSVERLSSGFKINRGADGPAALVISEKQRAQIAGLEQAIENAEKAVSLVQTAEGALSEINSLLIKVRSLAIDSANTGVNDADALAANQAEIDNALDTIDRIANNTQFLTKKLLNGAGTSEATATDTNVTVVDSGAALAGSHAIEVTTAAERAVVQGGAAYATITTSDETLTINGENIVLAVGTDLTAAVNLINAQTATTGAVARDNGGVLEIYSEDFGSAASLSVVSDRAAGAGTSQIGTTALTDDGVDIAGTIDGDAATGVGAQLTSTAAASTGLTVDVAEDGSNLLVSASGSLGTVDTTDDPLSFQFQIGPNANQTADVDISRVNPTSLGVGVSGSQFRNLNEIDVSTGAGAQDALAVIDAAIDDITSLRGDLGAFQQNTLSATANNLRTTLENSVNAESVIRDTDFAAEIANFTQQQVLVQAGTSVLGNANQLPQLVLALLG